MARLNFSWVIDGELARHGAPQTPDDLEFLKDMGIKALVRMAEEDKAHVTPDEVEAAGFIDCHEPVPDFTPPTPSQIDRMIGFIKQCVSEGKPVAVSCGAGVGRTGTILACYLVSKCRTADEAMAEVKRTRGAEIETDKQKEAVRSYARLLGK